MTEDGTTINYTTNELGQYGLAGLARLEHDQAGNLCARRNSAGDVEYEHDFAHRPTTIRDNQGERLLGNDAFGNLLQVEQGAAVEARVPDPLSGGIPLATWKGAAVERTIVGPHGADRHYRGGWNFPSPSLQRQRRYHSGHR